jgi:hypothetical protein
MAKYTIEVDDFVAEELTLDVLKKDLMRMENEVKRLNKKLSEQGLSEDEDQYHLENIQLVASLSDTIKYYGGEL